MIYVGSWAIDTKRKDTVTVVATIDGGSKDLYVVETDDGDCYVISGDYLIPYDKYYFDKNR